MAWRSDFIVLDGEAPAAGQLARLRASASDWVLVEREGGRWRYVFSRAELLAHPLLAGRAPPQATLTQTLNLHEWQSSRQVGPGAPPDQGVHGGQGAPTAAREVEVDAGGRAVAIGGPDVPRVRLTRGMRPSPAPEAPQAAGAEPPGLDEVFLGAAPPRLPADDEGTAPVRYPSIEPDAPLQPGARVTLVVDLLREASATTSGGPLDLGVREAGWQQLPLGVTLVAGGIAFDADGRGEVVIRRNQASLAAHIGGRVQADLPVGSEIEVSAQFWDGTRCSGAAKRRLMVGGASAGAPATPAEGAVRVEPGAEAPDLTVYITQIPGGSGGLLHWRLQTPAFDALPPRLDGFIDLGQGAAGEAATMFKQFANLERGKHRARIEGFGEKLWDRAPAEFRACYWALHDHYRRPLTIQFCSDDPHLPWELMRPYRQLGGADEVHPPLALRHAVARWIGRYQGYLRNQLPAGRMVAIAPHYKSASTRLSLAEATAAMLVERFGARRVTGSLAGMSGLLEQPGDEPVALLYFTGHGLFNVEAADASAIKLEDGNLAVGEVGRRETRLGERWGTLVFFNACEVGATGTALGSVGGWADAFTSRRFRGFIAPLWAIDEEDASQVTQTLMQRIVGDRMPVASALRDLRAEYGDVSPTFFSYLLYGDVTARLG